MSGRGRRRPRDPNGPPAVADPLALSSGRGRWVIAATVLGSGIAMLDATVVGIALPSISRDFHGGVGTLQWVVTGYAFTLAAFLLLGRVPRRPLRAEARLLHRRRLVRRRLGPLRPRAERGAPHRRPGAPGHRRRAADPGQPRHPAGFVPPRRPGPRHRRLVRTGRRRRRRRAVGGRLPPRHRLVALGLLHQPPRRRRRARDHGPPRARVARPDEQRPHRRGRRRAGRRVPRRPDLRAHRGTDPGMVEPGRGGLSRGRRRRRRPSSSFVEHRRSQPDAPARAVPLPPVQRGQRRHLRRLRRPRRCAVPAPRRAADREGLHPARVRRGAAPLDARHARLLRPVRRAVGADRPPAADDGRARSSSPPASSS